MGFNFTNLQGQGNYVVIYLIPTNLAQMSLFLTLILQVNLCKFHPIKVVFRYRDPQLQMGEKS